MMKAQELANDYIYSILKHNCYLYIARLEFSVPNHVDIDSVAGHLVCSVVEHLLPKAPVLTWDPAEEAHPHGPISKPGVVKALVAAWTVFSCQENAIKIIAYVVSLCFSLN